MTFPCMGLTPHDPVRAAALPDIFAHARETSPPPATLDRSNIALHPSLGDNGWAPDCTGESAREMMTAIGLLAGGYTPAIKPGMGLKFYCKAAGLPDNATDEQIALSPGCDMLTVAQRLMSPGFDTGYELNLALFGQARSLDIETLANGAHKFGLLWVGGVIYQRDQDNFYSSAPFDDDGSTDNGQLLGGHAFCSGWGWDGLDPTSFTNTITWGAQKPSTWRWLIRRANIALCLRWPQLDPAGAVYVDEQSLTAALTNWATA